MDASFPPLTKSKGKYSCFRLSFDEPDFLPFLTLDIKVFCCFLHFQIIFLWF